MWQIIELHGTLTAGDFTRFHYAHRLRQTWGVILAAFIFGVALLLITSLYAPSTLVIGVRFLVGMFAIGLILALVYPFRAARRHLKNQPFFRDPIIERFKPIGYEVEGTEFSTEVEWKDLRQVCETRTLFLIYNGPETAHMVPKRFFRSQDEIDAWRRVVEAGIAPRTISKPGFVGRWF